MIIRLTVEHNNGFYTACSYDEYGIVAFARHPDRHTAITRCKSKTEEKIDNVEEYFITNITLKIDIE